MEQQHDYPLQRLDIAATKLADLGQGQHDAILPIEESAEALGANAVRCSIRRMMHAKE